MTLYERVFEAEEPERPVRSKADKDKYMSRIGVFRKATKLGPMLHPRDPQAKGKKLSPELIKKILGR